MGRPGRPLLPLGGHRNAPYPHGREEEGLPSQAAGIIPEDPRVSQACAWGCVGAHSKVTPKAYLRPHGGGGGSAGA